MVAAVLGAASLPADAAVEVEAHVGRRNIAVGESTPLDIVVRGATANISDPEFDVPNDIEVLGSGRTQSFSWVNGRASSQVSFRYELAPRAAGTFSIGPIRVKVGNQVYLSPALTLVVGSGAREVDRAGAGPAELVTDVSPSEPYVGQPVLLRVRLVQRAPLAEDPRYTAPATPGFWAERPSEPESYYGAQGGARVLVTETRVRLYPLASGRAEIAQASAILVLARGSFDPLRWFGGRGDRREVAVSSVPLRVRVRPLPRAAPRGFDGAVGQLTLSWAADRASTAQDAPVTVRLDIRGIGNMPLIHTPSLASRDFEVFTSVVDDSLGVPGTLTTGRRRFQWTVVPRRQGRLELAAPKLAWFDPAAGSYRSETPPPIVIDVGPALAAGPESGDAFPSVFAANPVDSAARAPDPWGWALAGLALGASLVLWRQSRRAAPDQPERAQQREWLRAVGLSAGPDFWRAATRACEWLAARDRPAQALQRDIEASRYGGTKVDPEAVRRRLIERLSEAVPPPVPRWMPRVGSIALAMAAVILCLAFGPRASDPSVAVRARVADSRARAGDVERARREWLALWRDGVRAQGLAARLAWAAARSGEIAPASVWVLKGEVGEPRDPGLSWVRHQVREAGGLTGSAPVRLPIRPIEWCVLAVLSGAVAGLAFPRRWVAAAALMILVTCAVAYPLEGWLARRAGRAVLTAPVTLGGSDLELEPGQVVRIVARSGARLRAVVGRGVSGWIPASALARVDEGS